MPRSSRSKSHKQSKHSSKEAAAREYSGSDEDVKVKDRSSNGGKEDAVSVKIAKDSSVSREKVKHSKDAYNSHGNEDVSEKNHGGSDRWNGGISDDKGLLVNIDNKEVLKSKDSSKVVSESKSKSSRRHDADTASLVELEKDENRSGSGNRSEKRKSEKESARKESSQYKEHKGSKDKDRASDRGRKTHSDKLGVEATSKQVENQSSRRGKEITEWPIEEELRNPELEKELEKRMRRRGEASSEKDRYQDDIEDRRRSDRSKDERHKIEEYGDIKETRKKDEKHREDGERERKNRDVKHRGESERYSNHRDGKYDKYREDKYSEEGNKETRYKEDKYVDIVGDKDERSRDGKRRQDDDNDDDRDYRQHKEEKRARDSKYGEDVPEPKRLRDDSDSYHRKTSKRDGSPVYDDRVSRYKDDKDRRRGNNNEKDESSDYRSRSSTMKEQRSDLDKRSSAKDDLVSERGRLGSRNADVENTTTHSRHRSSPSYPTRDHHRGSKQEETKYRDYAYEDRARHNDYSSRDYDFAPGQSDKKASSKDDGYMVGGGDLSSEKRTRHDSRSSPQIDKSPSSSNDRRNLIKSDARKNPDLEESGSGQRSGGTKDTFKDGRGSRELANEAHLNNDFSHFDNDNLSVSSPYTRNSHFSEDEKNKSNNRQRRMADQNMNRGQSQMQNQGNWKNNPNWHPPMAPGGYIPFQHVPPPMFHPLMQQFPPPMFGRPPMKLNPGLPYHPPDHGRPPSLHGWDANNSVFGEEAHLYGRVDWDRRSQMSNQGWDQSGEMWKAQNSGSSMEGQQKDAFSGHRPNDENLSGPPGQLDESDQNQQLDIKPETLNLDRNDAEPQKPTGSPKIFEAVKEDNKAVIAHAYLSRVDVSKDLTQPELYEQYTTIMDLDPEEFIQPVDELDYKILYLEESVEANVADNASIFAAINDSVFQKAVSLYKKQKEEFHPINTTNKEKSGSNDDDDDGKTQLAEVAAVAEDTVMEEVNKEDDGPSNKPEEPPMDADVNHVVVKQEEEPESTGLEVKQSLEPSASSGAGLLPCKVEDATEDDNNGDDSLVLSDVSNAELAVMPTESVEFGSVNLNRIHHHSPESTH